MNYLLDEADEFDATITVADLRLALERVCAAVAERRGFVDAGEKEHLLALLAHVAEADASFLPSLPPYAQHLVKELLPHLRPGHGIH